MALSTFSFDRIVHVYPHLMETLDRIVTGAAFFSIFQQLSDNYSPTLTVSRVQGPLVEQIIATGAGNHSRLLVDRNTRRSGSITVKVGSGYAPIWLSAHSDICSYLTGRWDGSGYPVTPFCMHRARSGRRAAMALAEPCGEGPLERLIEGTMVTLESGQVRFECADQNLPLSTRIVHHCAAAWDRNTDQLTGFLDNQAGSTAMLLAAQVLSHYDVNVLLLLNDEEEGPVDMGNQGFSRAANRLFHRTPIDELPNYVVVTDGHSQEVALKGGDRSAFGSGASFSGLSSMARGAVTPPQLLAFTRELAGWLATQGIALRETASYVGRSDDISAMQFTPNVSIIGYPNTYSHFEEQPLSHMNDLLQLTKTLVILALIAQDTDWQKSYL